jgi:sirohydrochlorin cobaltochelatase
VGAGLKNEPIQLCLVCTNIGCKVDGSIAVAERILDYLEAAGSEVEVLPYRCFGACHDGPNIVLFPEGTWYAGVQQSDAEAIAQHILGGDRVEHLTGRIPVALQNLIQGILHSQYQS